MMSLPVVSAGFRSLFQAVYRQTALLVRRSTPDPSRHWDFDDASIFAQVMVTKIDVMWGKTRADAKSSGLNRSGFRRLFHASPS